jgi:hypothetical protein
LTQEQSKKGEKERYEAKKQLEAAQISLEKLRKERDELWAIVNTDKYKNVRTVEIEKEKIEKLKTEAECSLASAKEEVLRLETKVSELEAQFR